MNEANYVLFALTGFLFLAFIAVMVWDHMNKEPIGYVCDSCGWWVPTLSQTDPHCNHLVISLPENLPAEIVREAKQKAGVI